MSRLISHTDVDEVEVSASAKEAALRVVDRLTREKEAIAAEWATAVRLAKANGASLREIAQVAGTSPQSVANLLHR